MAKPMDIVGSFYAPRLAHGTDTRSDASWSYPIHRHVGSIDVVLCLEGHVEHVINDESIRQSPGRVVLVRDGDVHAQQGQDFRFLNIDLPGSALMLLAEGMGLQKRVLKALRQKKAVLFDLGELEETVVEKAHRFIDRQYGDEAPVFLRSFLADVLAALALSQKGAADKRMPWLRALCDRIELNLSETNARDLPALAGRSAAHISRSFKETLGITPSQYIRQLRIERAAVRLAATNEEISEICFDLGFGSLSYFYRLFHERKGMAPLEFRMQNNPFFGFH